MTWSVIFKKYSAMMDEMKDMSAVIESGNENNKNQARSQILKANFCSIFTALPLNQPEKSCILDILSNRNSMEPKFYGMNASFSE